MPPAVSVLWYFYFTDLFFFSANLYKKFGLLQTFIDLAYIELLSGEKLLPTTDTDVRDLELVRKSFTAVKLNTSRT